MATQQESPQLFTKEALEKLHSPDRLDAMLSVTTPAGWGLLVAVGVILASVLLWSIFGSLTVTAEGMGLIMDAAGLVSVNADVSGRVERVYVRVGDRVKRGMLLATLLQEEKEANTRIRRQGIGLASNDREVRSRVQEYDADLYRTNVTSEIYSHFDGIVDEVLVGRGDKVQDGAFICTVRRDRHSKELNGIFYIPVEKGKRVESGQTIQIVPNGVDVAESGSLVGIVKSVSQYPVSAQTLQRHLGNPQLAQWISTKQGSAVMEVWFSLLEDPSSPSGYLWTTTVGDHKPVSPGSFCTGAIIIERKPPIERVFYKITQWLRSR